jgi:hypothetical protein
MLFILFSLISFSGFAMVGSGIGASGLEGVAASHHPSSVHPMPEPISPALAIRQVGAETRPGVFEPMELNHNSLLRDFLATKAAARVKTPMRNLLCRDSLGFVSGVTSSSLLKIAAGLSSVCISALLLNSETMQKSSAPSTFSGNMTFSDLMALGLTIDFSQVNSTDFSTYHYHSTKSSPAVTAAAWGGIVMGGFSILSGLADLVTSGYMACRSGDNFEEMVREAFKRRIEMKRPLKPSDFNMDLFADFAVGEYIDLYHKRGPFNESKFIAALVRY